MVKTIIIAIFITLGVAMCCSCDQDIKDLRCPIGVTSLRAIELKIEGKKDRCGVERYYQKSDCTYRVIRLWDGKIYPKPRTNTLNVPFHKKGEKDPVFCVKE